MQVLIEAPFTINDKMKSEITESVKSLDRFHDKISQAHVYFKTGDGTGEAYHSADIQLHIPGPPLFVSANAPTPMEAFLDAIEKMEGAMRKEKSIREDKYKQRL